jgi:hypothetical protein
MAQRDNRRIDLHQTAAGPTGRSPVQSSTPLGPDQVNVLLLLGPEGRGEVDEGSVRGRPA